MPVSGAGARLQYSAVEAEDCLAKLVLVLDCRLLLVNGAVEVCLAEKHWRVGDYLEKFEAVPILGNHCSHIDP